MSNLRMISTIGFAYRVTKGGDNGTGRFAIEPEQELELVEKYNDTWFKMIRHNLDGKLQYIQFPSNMMSNLITKEKYEQLTDEEKEKLIRR